MLYTGNYIILYTLKTNQTYKLIEKEIRFVIIRIGKRGNWMKVFKRYGLSVMR